MSVLAAWGQRRFTADCGHPATHLIFGCPGCERRHAARLALMVNRSRARVDPVPVRRESMVRLAPATPEPRLSRAEYRDRQRELDADARRMVAVMRSPYPDRLPGDWMPVARERLAWIEPAHVSYDDGVAEWLLAFADEDLLPWEARRVAAVRAWSAS